MSGLPDGTEFFFRHEKQISIIALRVIGHESMLYELSYRMMKLIWWLERIKFVKQLTANNCE